MSDSAIKNVKENKVSVTARLDKGFVDEIEEIAESIYANKTSILQECLRFGLEEFKKRRPDIIKSVESVRVRNKQAEKFLDQKKTA